MKKAILSLIICTFSFASMALADDVYTQGGRATVFNPSEAGFFSNSSFYFKKLSANSARLLAIGGNVDSDARLVKLIRLQTANYSVKNGFSYFVLRVTKKSLSCKNMMFTSSWAIQPKIEAEVTFANTKFGGAVDANLLLKLDAASLSSDAPQAEKDAAFSSWRDTCYSKYPPQTIAHDQAVARLTNVLADSALRIMFFHR